MDVAGSRRGDYQRSSPLRRRRRTGRRPSSPDLIVGSTATSRRSCTASCPRSRPSLARPAEYPDSGCRWTGAEHRRAGAGRGRSRRAAAGGHGRRLDSARQANPDFAGKTIAAVMPRTNGAGWSATPRSTHGSAPLELGSTQSPNIALPADQPFNIEISRRTPPISTPTSWWSSTSPPQGHPAGRPAVLAVPAVQDGRVAWVTDDNELAAYWFNSWLSLPFALDALLRSWPPPSPAAAWPSRVPRSHPADRSMDPSSSITIPENPMSIAPNPHHRRSG